jgi:hypothetical protein
MLILFAASRRLIIAEAGKEDYYNSIRCCSLGAASAASPRSCHVFAHISPVSHAHFRDAFAHLRT